MNVKRIFTRSTKESGKGILDRFDYTHSLEFDGKLILRTRVEKNGQYKSGSCAEINEGDKSLIKKLFHGLEFLQFEYDGIPVFKHGEEIYHLQYQHTVTMAEDDLEV